MSIITMSPAAQRVCALSLTRARFAAMPTVHVPADLGRDAYNAKGSPPRGELR